MNIRTIGFLDVSRVAASFVLVQQKRMEGEGVKTLRPLDDGTDWRSLKTFLTKLRNEASPLFGGKPPVLGDVLVRSLEPGARIDWSTGTEDNIQVHVCLVPSPGAWLYCGGEGAVLQVGTVTFVNHRAPHTEINFGPATMTKLIVELNRQPDADA